MAVPAGGLQVSALQRPAGGFMVKSDRRPGALLMAVLAAVFRIILFVEITIVHIVMAVNAKVFAEIEIPTAAFLMAGKTGSGHMSTFQGKQCFFMIFDRKSRDIKPIMHGMAFVAIGRDIVFGKLAAMVVGVAVCASRKINFVTPGACMTLFAIHITVHALKGEVGHAVVKG